MPTLREQLCVSVGDDVNKSADETEMTKNTKDAGGT